MRSFTCGLSPSPVTFARIGSCRRRKNASPLLPMRHRLTCAPRRLPFAQQNQHLLEDVCVQAARESTVRGDDDDADRFRLALRHERMLVIGIRLGQMTDHLPDLVRIGPRELHAVLRAPHLARGHHLHGLGDLLSALHTRDLGADFLRAGHGWLSTFPSRRNPRRCASASPRDPSIPACR